MSQITILFRRDRVWLAAFVSVLLASIVVGLVLQATRTYNANAFVTGDITNTGAPTATVGISDTDVPIMNVLLPTPIADTLVHDGAGSSPAGSVLTDFAAAEKFSDGDHDDANDYTDDTLVVNSDNETVTSGEVLTAGAADLTTFDLSEPGLEVFADTQTDNNLLDANEDIYRQETNGMDVFVNDGSLLFEDFAATVMFYDDNTVGDNGLYDDTEAVISDVDADGLPTADDSVVRSGKAGVIAIELSDDLILDDLNSDGNYDANERIWKEMAFSPSVFSAGVDYVIVGSAAATCEGLCTPIDNLANNSGLAFLDDNNDAIYTSTRNVSAETIVWFGNTETPTNGVNLPTNVTFFDPAQLADDDVNGVWLEDLNAFSATNDFYVVTVADAAYAEADDIFQLVHNGSQASGDGSEVRTMGANDKYSDTNNSSTYTDGELVATSVDANLAGSEIVISGTVDLTAFDSSTTPFFKYVDDGDVAYEDGEDIYQDTDDSGYVNADKLTGITVKNTGTALDADISELSVWIDDGDGTFESGQDNQVLTDVDATYFDSRETIAGTVFTAAQRIFVTVNISATPTNARTIIAQLTDGAAGGDGDCTAGSADEAACAILFASTNDGPSDAHVTNANTITIDAALPTATAANITTTISTDANADGIAAIGDSVRVVWRGDLDGFTDIASASLSLAEFGQGSSYTMAEDDGIGNDCVDNDVSDANVFCYTFSLSADVIDTTGRNSFVTGTDDVGNVSAAVEDDSNISVDVLAPVVTNGAISISGGSGTGGAYKIGSTVSGIWNNDTDANADETTVTVNFTQFGGGAAVAASEASNIWTATFPIIAGSIDDANNNVSVTVTDDAGNATTTADTSNATVDSIAPTVTNGAISISGASGTGGAYKVGDTVTATWDNVTDANADEAVVTVNYSAMGGGAAVAAADGDANETWVATYVASSGSSVDDVNLNVSVTVTDDAGNPVTVADTTNATFDNVFPTVTAGAITVSGATGLGGAYKIGDTVSTVWDNDVDVNTDESTVQMDYGPFNGGTTVAATEASNEWTSTYTIAAGSVDDANNAVAVTVIDNAGNVATTFDNVLATVDNIRPTFSTIEVQDTNTNGTIETLAIVFSEAIADLDAAPAANGFNVTSAANHGGCTGELIDPNGSASRNLTVTCTSAYTAVGDMNVVFTGSSSITDDAGNQVSTVTMTSAVGAGPAITDNADPVLMTIDPTSAETSVLTDDNVIMTFSEPMNTTFAEGTEFTVTPDATTWTSAASSSDKVITLDHPNDFNCNTVYTVTLDEAQIASAAAETLLTTGPEDETWTFTTRACSSSGSGGSSGGSSSMTSTTPVVTLTNPDDGDTLEGGDEVAVTWSTSGSGIDTISLAYSTDDGSTYDQVAYNVDEDDGTFTWTVPNENATDVLLKITAYDTGKGTLDTDTVTIDLSYSSEAAAEEAAEEETIGSTEGTEMDSEGRNVATGSGDYGTSPLDGTEEEISDVQSGQFIRSYGFSSIYYVDPDLGRRVFWDTNTFFTWADSWDNVVWVTDATLPTLTFGDAFLPKPGVVLVKIQSDPKVYAIDEDGAGNPVLRWVPSEDVAIALYGSDWADYVIDIDATIFSKFEMGDDMTDDEDVDTSIMKTRVELAELAQG